MVPEIFVLFLLIKFINFFPLTWHVGMLFTRILLARLEYLRDTFQIKEGDFLTFDALVYSTAF